MYQLNRHPIILQQRLRKASRQQAAKQRKRFRAEQVAEPRRRGSPAKVQPVEATKEHVPELLQISRTLQASQTPRTLNDSHRLKDCIRRLFGAWQEHPSGIDSALTVSDMEFWTLEFQRNLERDHLLTNSFVSLFEFFCDEATHWVVQQSSLCQTLVEALAHPTNSYLRESSLRCLLHLSHKGQSDAFLHNDHFRYGLRLNLTTKENGGLLPGNLGARDEDNGVVVVNHASEIIHTLVESGAGIQLLVSVEILDPLLQILSLLRPHWNTPTKDPTKAARLSETIQMILSSFKMALSNLASKRKSTTARGMRKDLALRIGPVVRRCLGCTQSSGRCDYSILILALKVLEQMPSKAIVASGFCEAAGKLLRQPSKNVVAHTCWLLTDVMHLVSATDAVREFGPAAARVAQTSRYADQEWCCMAVCKALAHSNIQDDSHTMKEYGNFILNRRGNHVIWKALAFTDLSVQEAACTALEGVLSWWNTFQIHRLKELPSTEWSGWVKFWEQTKQVLEGLPSKYEASMCTNASSAAFDQQTQELFEATERMVHRIDLVLQVIEQQGNHQQQTQQMQTLQLQQPPMQENQQRGWQSPLPTAIFGVDPNPGTKLCAGCGCMCRCNLNGTKGMPTMEVTPTRTATSVVGGATKKRKLPAEFGMERSLNE